MSLDETQAFQQAVDQARERIEEVSVLLVAANELDQQADVVVDVREIEVS